MVKNTAGKRASNRLRAKAEIEKGITENIKTMNTEQKNNNNDIAYLLKELLLNNQSKISAESFEKIIPNYDGKTIPVKIWFENFDKNAEAYNLSDNQKYVHARNKMIDVANLFLQTQIMSSYEDLKMIVSEEFTKEFDSEEIHRMLTQRKKKNNEDFQNYVLQMRNIAGLGKVEISALIKYVIEGLNINTEAKYLLYKSKNLKELKENYEIVERVTCSLKQNNTKEIRRSINKNDSYNKTESKNIIRCFKCGSLEHIRSECNNDTKCFKCNKNGHISPNCPNTIKDVNIAEKERRIKIITVNDHDDSDDITASIEEHKEHDEPFVELEDDSEVQHDDEKVEEEEDNDVDREEEKEEEGYEVESKHANYDKDDEEETERDNDEDDLEEEEDTTIKEVINDDEDAVDTATNENLEDNEENDSYDADEGNENKEDNAENEEHKEVFDKEDNEGVYKSTEQLVVENDAEELLLLQKKAREKQAAANSENAASAESENGVDDDIDANSADMKFSWATQLDQQSNAETLMKRRIKIATEDDVFPEDVNIPLLPNDEEEYSEVEIESEEEMITNFYEDRRKLRENTRKRYNRKRKKELTYKEGDLVAIKRTQFIAGKKLASKYIGPYEIINVKANGRYDVKKAARNEGPNSTSTSADNIKLWKYIQENDDLMSSGTDDELQDGRM